MDIIGREKEKSILKKCFESDRSEFVAVYGRRRVKNTLMIIGSDFLPRRPILCGAGSALKRCVWFI